MIVEHEPEQLKAFPESEIEPQKDEPLLSRREFVAALGLLGVSALAGYKASEIGIKIPEIKLPDVKLFEETDNIASPEVMSGGSLVLGSEETTLSLLESKLAWIPDGRLPYFTTKEGNRRFFLSGGPNNATYMVEVDKGKTLKEEILNKGITRDEITEVYSPDANSEYKRHYAGLTSILQLDKNNPDHLIGIAHCELRKSRNESGTFTATIAQVESFDAGKSWQDKGPLIVGQEPSQPGERATGAGQPSAILGKDGYVYILYIDWAAQNQVKHKDQLYLARAKVNDDSTLGKVEYLKDNGFGDFEVGKLKSAIPVQDSIKDAIYMALPSVSWNEHLNQYICTGECDRGFWFATSEDLVNWSQPELIYDFEKYGGKPHNILKVGEKWDSYPSFLDETKPTSEITGEKGIFYHSSGNNLIGHQLMSLDGEIKS